jgi:hypothetical protein
MKFLVLDNHGPIELATFREGLFDIVWIVGQ